MFPELTRDDVFRLETARFWLRWPRGRDVEALVKGAGDRLVADMTGTVPHPYGPADAEEFILRSRAANADGRGLTLAITPRREPGRLVGVVSIDCEREAEPSIGYWIAAGHRDGGVATEAARALIDAFFAYSGGTALTASARVINPASRRVLEKCGFIDMGSALSAFPARGGVLPVDLFRLDRDSWSGLKACSDVGFVSRSRQSDFDTGCVPCLRHVESSLRA